MVLLLMAFLLTRINTNPTNRLLETVKTSINHEYHIKDDSLRIYNRAKNIFDSTIESVPVFNTDNKLSSPVVGTVIRKFDFQLESSDGRISNGGVEIKLEKDMEPQNIIDGRVTKIVKKDNKGYFISLEEGNIKITYGYLQNTHLKEGDLVKKDDIIGQVGVNKDGNKYLRIELYIDNELVDPEKYIDL